MSPAAVLRPRPRPRPRRLATAAALAGLAGLVAAACEGTTPPPGVETPPVEPPVTPPVEPPPPPPPLRLTVVDVLPRADTLTQLGLELVARIDGSVVRAGTVYVDSGTAAERVVRVKEPLTGYDSDLLFGAVFVPGAGRHRFTIVATDTGGRTVSGTFERTVVLDDAPYAVTPLPDSGSGGAAGISAGGDVTGWVASDGRRRPAVWRGTTLAVVPAADTVDVVATAVNAAGDVLLQYDPARARASAARVRRADGTELVIAPARAGEACCALAVELTESRRALGTAGPPLPGAPSEFGASAILDVAAGGPAELIGLQLYGLNARGEWAGFETTGAGYRSRVLRTSGFAAPALPTGHMVSICDRPRRWSSVVPLALDDEGNVLADYCGNVVLLARAGGSVFVDRLVGRSPHVRLSRQGGLVAALDSTGTLHLWRIGTARTTRVRPADAEWRVTELAGVTGDGVISASGVHAATGRRAALRLTPAR